jgi:hypothetical protein
MYLITLVLLLVILPAVSIILEYVLWPGAAVVALVGKWYSILGLRRAAVAGRD